MTAVDPALLEELRKALTPPDDFKGRMDENLRAKLLDHETLTLASEMFGVGLRTTRMMLEEENHDDG